MQNIQLNAQCTIYINHPKKTFMEGFAKVEEYCPNRVHSDQMVLGTVRWEAGPYDRQPKAFKNKLVQGGPSGLSPLGSYGSCDGHEGGWTS
jgi:hypothetical protein